MEQVTSRIREPQREVVVTPPYVSFSTFKTLLEWLSEEGVPLRFDRSFWQAKFSGSNGTQLTAALRFLGLLSGDRPMSDLESLVQADIEERRFVLAVLLKDSYKAISFEELSRGTPNMLRDWFRAYPIDGHTLRKAISFFVNAAREAQLPMSNAVSKMAKSKGTVRGQPSARSAQPVTDERPRPAQAATPRPIRDPATRTVVELDSGGTVTVDLAVDLFRLSEEDRKFVLKFVDLTQNYKPPEEE